MATPAAASDWIRYWDEASSDYYYHRPATGETSWEQPDRWICGEGYDSSEDSARRSRAGSSLPLEDEDDVDAPEEDLFVVRASLSGPPPLPAGGPPPLSLGAPPPLPVAAAEPSSAQREERRRRVLGEILSTERTYVAALQTLEKVYMVPMRMVADAGAKVAIFSHADLDTVFLNLDVLLKLHARFLERLEQEEASGHFGAILSGAAKDIKGCYTRYISNYAQAEAHISALASKAPDKHRYLEVCKSHPDAGGLDVRSFLIQPIQRVPRYRLLLEELLAHTEPGHPDEADLREALARIREVAAFINEWAPSSAVGQLACMSHPLPPDRPKPSHDYVKEQRAKLAPAEKAPQTCDVALCINGGGLLPPAAMFGVYRGLAKMKTTPRKPKCDNVLDNFDVIGGASGGAIAATVYCYSESEPCTFFGTDDPANDPDPSKITKAAMEAEPAPYGKMLAAPYGPALCFPLRPAFCCIPLAVWTVIDYALGTPIRALGCGKWVGCGCYPCATGFGVAWIEFMYANFVGPLGIRRGSTEPPTRPEAPTPLGLATMGSLADVAPKDYIGIVRDWTIGAWKKVWDDGIVNELVPGVKQFNTCRDVEVKGEDKSLTLGLPLKTGLEYQWADGQSGSARGLTFVPYVFTPHSAATKYEPLPLGACNFDDKQMYLPQKGCGPCLTPQRTALFDATSGPAQSFVLPPACKPFGHPPSARHLSPETVLAMSGDFFGIAGFLDCLPRLFGPFDVALRIKTAEQPGNEETCFFADGGTIDGTAVAAVVAQGARKATAVITNLGQSPFGPNGNLEVHNGNILALLSLFGATPSNKKFFPLPNRTPAGAWGPTIMNQIFDNDVESFDLDGTAKLVSPQEEVSFKGMRPLDCLVCQMKECYKRGEALVATLKGLKVIDNTYYGTHSSQDCVELTVIFYAPPKRWMDLINRNPDLNPKAHCYISEYHCPDEVVTGMSPYAPKYNVFDKKDGKAPYKNFPPQIDALPVKALSYPEVNLFGFCGDYIVQYSPLLDRLFTSEPRIAADML